MQQFDLFQGAGNQPPDFRLLSAATQSAHFVLPCGRRKEDEPTTAREMYKSPRFRNLLRIVDDLSVPYQIASAKHGLISPETIIAPYDTDLAALPVEGRVDWAKRILDSLKGQTAGQIVSFLNGVYADALRHANEELPAPLIIFAPLAGLSTVAEDDWIRQATALAARFRDARKLYDHIGVARQKGETFFLRDLPHKELPERGVYLFLDPSEPSALCVGPRIVRVGTHAVSQGSKATLRGRLRNHLGPSHGGGGHRGSVFRLHVGRALLNAEPERWGPMHSWGIEQQASRDILEKELPLEKRVSEYLGGLEVFVLAIDDAPSKTSLRAIVETQLIGLMTANNLPVEPPSPHWLGRSSDAPDIITTGLWNVRDVGRPYWPSRKGSVAHIISGKI